MVMMLMRLVVCDGDAEAGVSAVYAVYDVYDVDAVDAGVGGEWDWHDGNVVIITPSPIRGRRCWQPYPTPQLPPHPPLYGRWA